MCLTPASGRRRADHPVQGEEHHVQLWRSVHPRAAAEGQADRCSSTSIVEGGSHDVVLKNATPSIMNG